MGTAIRRDHVVNRVNGNPHPFAIQFDFVVVLNHSTFGRATIQQVAARTFAVISLELRVEPLMPVTVAHPVTSVLCLCADTKKHREGAAAKSSDEGAPPHPSLPKESARLAHSPGVSALGEKAWAADSVLINAEDQCPSWVNRVGFAISEGGPLTLLNSPSKRTFQVGSFVPLAGIQPLALLAGQLNDGEDG